MKNFRTFLFLVFFISIIVSANFSLQTDARYGSEVTGDTAVAVDMGMDGGAAGFATLSGLTLIAISITYLREEKAED